MALSPSNSRFTGGTVMAGAVGESLSLDPSAPSITLEGIGSTGKLFIEDDFSASQCRLTSSGINLVATGGIISRDDVGGANAVSMRASGVWLAVHSSPADIDLSAGDCVLWFDQTNGAAKLMVKAKQADGAVKTAAVALA